MKFPRTYIKKKKKQTYRLNKMQYQSSNIRDAEKKNIKKK